MYHFLPQYLVDYYKQHCRGEDDTTKELNWVIEGVEGFGDDQMRHMNVFYDQRVKLICSANATPEWLVVDDRVVGANASLGATTATDASMMVSAEFARTASRLREMQSKEYFSRKHASADNPQVLQTN